MILHEVHMVFPSCVLTLFTSWWLQTLPPTYLSNLDPGLWPDPIGVWRLAQWNQRNEKTTGPFASGDAVGILLINLVFWEESLGSFDLHLHQMIPPILSRLSYVHGLAHAFAGFIEPQHFEVLSSRIAQVCLAWRTKTTTPESSDAVMLVDDWWFQFVAFTSNIPTNHPFFGCQEAIVQPQCLQLFEAKVLLPSAVWLGQKQVRRWQVTDWKAPRDVFLETKIYPNHSSPMILLMRIKLFHSIP